VSGPLQEGLLPAPLKRALELARAGELEWRRVPVPDDASTKESTCYDGTSNGVPRVRVFVVDWAVDGRTGHDGTVTMGTSVMRIPPEVGAVLHRLAKEALGA
jgi:hypothetical protein